MGVESELYKRVVVLMLMYEAETLVWCFCYLLIFWNRYTCRVMECTTGDEPCIQACTGLKVYVWKMHIGRCHNWNVRN